ncbi:MAG: phosphatidylserine decarboxylase [Simkania negevensis]|nr:phosphatidylserine decarboxylase [Simkania negevensis]
MKNREDIYCIDRETGQTVKEKVYGGFFLKVLYGSFFFSKTFLPLICRLPFFSWWYGYLQKTSWSKRKISPFIKNYEIDEKEFASPLSSFSSFNDFFIRKLQSRARPIAKGENVAIMPTDGRYLVFPDLSQVKGFYVKGQTFDLPKLLQNKKLSAEYEQGAMVIARLCPTDYHRFHFPCDCIPKAPSLIKGPLYSVNPIALRKYLSILSENRRFLTELQTKHFGKVLFIEVGATHVGSIKQTYQPERGYRKGEEKGYFEFGGSSLLLLFPPASIAFDEDLIEASKKHLEMRGKLGQSLGRLL